MRRDFLFRSSALRKHRYEAPNHIYHIVKCLRPACRSCVDLTNATLAEIVVSALMHQREKYGCRLFAFVVMPDHLHWLFALSGDVLVKRVKVFVNWCAYRINRVLSRQGALWQDGYYDHLVREHESLSGLIRYIEANPVRKELCAYAEDWLWSSANLRWRDCLDRDWLGRGRFDEQR